MENNLWKQQKYNQIVKEMRRQLLSSYYRVRYTLLLYQTMGSCRDNALCRSLQANPLTVLHTQVLYHCTEHTGAVPLYCTHMCRTTVPHTQVLYTCNTHVIAVPLYCKHRCCTSIWKRKKQMSHKHDTPWKDKSWIYHPFTQQSSRLFHPQRVVSSEPCHYKRWQDWKNTMHVVTNSEEIKKCHLMQVSKPSDSQCAAAWRYASNSASAACSTTLLRWSL